MCKIKICGIKTQADIEIVNQYLPDFIGFNFIPSSKRAIDLEQAIRLKAAISPKIKSVGLFQNAEPDEIKRVFEAGIMALIQLHGKEGLLVASKIADRVGITRSVIVNALRKLESAGVIESRSLGMKGTYIKVLNEKLLTELEKLKAES